MFKSFIVYWLLFRVCLLGDLTDDDSTGFFEPGTAYFSERYVERVLAHTLWRGPDVEPIIVEPIIVEPIIVEPIIDWDELELAIQARHGVDWFDNLIIDWDELELLRAADINWLEDPSMSDDNEDPFQVPFLPESE